jgi:uncharacterized protein (DUF1015 family)
MASIYPFRGLRYSPDKVPIEKVVTQPYDKISKEMQERYYALHPQNMVRVVLGQAQSTDSDRDNVYTRATDYLREWRRAGVLIELSRPAFLAYFQRFTVPGTSEERLRKGFIGLGKLEDYANKVVFPHERTLTGPKKDRLELLRHTRTHFEQIFMLYEDPVRRIDAILDDIAKAAPDIRVADEYGVEHTVWIMDDPTLIESIQAEMAEKTLIIADGHHRYETGLAYRDEMRAAAGANRPDAAYERLPMAFFNMQNPGLTILPTHRVVFGLMQFEPGVMLHRASRYFDIDSASAEPEQFRSSVQEAGTRTIAIGVCLQDGRHLILRLKSFVERDLDVAILHRFLLEQSLDISDEAIKGGKHIAYIREFASALDAVEKGSGQVAFLLNPTRLEQMKDIAYAGQVMPQKSTDFYPKVLSGLIMYSLGESGL